MKDLVVVRFVQREPPYNVGETAGFGAATAQRLVEKGTAAYVDPADTPPGLATPATASIEVRRTAEPPFVETTEGDDGELEVKDVRGEQDKMVRAPRRRK